MTTVGVMAVVPWRIREREVVVSSLRGQVADFFLLHDGVDEIRYSSVGVTNLLVPPEWRGRGHLARLLPWWQDGFDDDTLVVVCDDDLVYPPDYVERTTAAFLEAEEQYGLVCVSWTAFVGEDYVQWDDVRPTAECCEVLGFGTSAFRLRSFRGFATSSILRMLQAAPRHPRVDPAVSAFMYEQGVALVHPAGSSGISALPCHRAKQSVWQQRGPAFLSELRARGWPGPHEKWSPVW